MALVDSGSERIFASPALAGALSLDLSDAIEVRIGLGGGTRIKEVTIQLYRDVLTQEGEPIEEWRADVGFLST